MMYGKHQIMVSFLIASLQLISGPVQAVEELDCVIGPKSTIKLGSPEEGILEEVLVDRGSRVKKGELVAKLDMEVERLSAELARLRAKADAEVRSGRVQVKFRSKEAARLEELYKDKTIAETQYDQANIEHQLAELSMETTKMEHRIAKVEYKRVKARLKRRGIRSPVNGIVVDVTMSPGEYVHEQAPIMTIVEVDPLNVEVFIPVSKYGGITEGMLAEVLPEEPVGGSFSAKVTVVDKVFDAASRTFGVRLVLPNPDYKLPAGLRCKVRFPQSASKKADKSPGISVAK